MSTSVAKLGSHVSLKYWGAGIALILLLAIYPHETGQMLIFALENMLYMVPVISIGVFLAAYVAATGATAVIAKAFTGKRSLWMIFLASLIGAILPVCGISVLPLIAGLLAAGVPLAAIMAFWLASPITSPSMLAVTVGILGWEFAIGKTLAAVGVGIFGGLITVLVQRNQWFAHPAKLNSIPSCDNEQSCRVDNQSLRWNFWSSAARRATFFETTLYTGKLMLGWLTVAFMAEYWLKLFLSADSLSQVVGNEQFYAVPLAAVIGAPLYLDGYAALPLVRGLIENGMAVGAAMAFLVAGGITSAWAAIPVYALVRLPVFFLYIVLAVICAMLAGWTYGAVIA
ncbi:MAG: permease [Pseudomonadota bacterium]